MHYVATLNDYQVKYTSTHAKNTNVVIEINTESEEKKIKVLCMEETSPADKVSPIPCLKVFCKSIELRILYVDKRR